MTNPQTITSEAAADIEAAESLVDALESKIRAGDLSVTVDELESARAMARFARLRSEGAQVRAADLDEKHQRAAEKKALDEHLPAVTASDEKVAKTVAQIRPLLEALFAETEAYNVHVRALARAGEHLSSATLLRDDMTPDRALVAGNADVGFFVTRDGVSRYVRSKTAVVRDLLAPYGVEV